MTPSSLLTPAISTGPSLPSFTKHPKIASSLSLHALADVHSAASSSSAAHLAQANPETVREEGLQHANIILEARQYKMQAFALQLLACLQSLRVPFWSTTEIKPTEMRIHKVSGSLTNAVFFVSYPNVQKSRTVLLRIYGLSSGSLISRPRELHTLHVLSSQYRIGPRVYGTFENGRIEEYFESTTLTPTDLRDPLTSRWIGARMAELHSVNIESVENAPERACGEGGGWELGAKVNVRKWLHPAEEVLALPFVKDEVRAELDLPAFKRDWSRYLDWLLMVDDIHNGSKRVFAHNDTQYGNILRLRRPKDFVDEHRQLIVVDFEYASPNPASFDIANHFHEWTADYHSATPHLLDPSRYPTYDERRNFYTAYLGHTALSGEYAQLDDAERELQLVNLDKQVRFWSPASHGMWAIWGIVQAREDMEGRIQEPEFNYLHYSLCRINAFRREIRELGI